MLNTWIFPDQLKLAKVVPIDKKDDETLFTNYKPISLLPLRVNVGQIRVKRLDGVK